MRLGGAQIPGVLSPGRFYFHGQLVFWDVHDGENANRIEPRDERYRLVLEVEDSEAEVARIQRAPAGAPGGTASS